MRELNIALFGTELIYILSLGIWLVWTALGAAVPWRRSASPVDRIRNPFLFIGLALPLVVVFIRGYPLIFKTTPGLFLPFQYQLLLIGIALSPIGFLLGWLFQWTAKAFMSDKRTLAAAYAIECAGGVAGGLGSGLALKWGVQNFTLMLICSLTAVVTAILFTHSRGRKLYYPGVIVGSLLLVLLIQSESVDHWMTSWNHPGLVSSKDTPYTRISVVLRNQQIIVFSNGEFAYETEGTAAEEFVHHAALQHPAPSNILILGGGVQGTIREVLKHRPERVTSVEMDAACNQLIVPLLSQSDRQAMSQPNVDHIIADPRRFLHNSGEYDLIYIGMPEPTSGTTNRFYTEEFFDLCSESLDPGGILSLKLLSSENQWTQPLILRTASIYNALSAVFGDVLILPGAMNVILASNTTLIRDPEVLGSRLKKRGIKTRVISEPFLEYLYTNDRFVEIPKLLSANPGILNRDSKPVCYQYTQLLWLSQFFPSLKNLDFTKIISEKGRVGGPTLAIVLMIPISLLLIRCHNRLKRIFLALISSFVGMVIETMLLLVYQSQVGALYRDLGILLSLFMAGLAAGAWMIHRLERSWIRRINTPAAGWCLVTLFGTFGIVVALLIRQDGIFSLFHTSLLIFLDGYFVAAIFAYCGMSEAEDPGALVSPLYTSDLIGGCLGSLAASLLLIPVAGMAASTWGAALLAFCLLLLI
ncbi:MAG: hypothetical protein KJ970_17965 [Candidatus Eisenbacteria bacterium]|uniref:Polyamine aminopropyltransferase n=1 Tax=Eiseniibacteriota bacterium TaxID=2212470 RepID=A0A948RXF1_UNCEI|nr:hypothetical protein [Candidatus Eisenbacteria bacterium]MBU1948864.1 hypothetical protein [Candidatus Eisenbacteria bacterium]MBU2692808.1 hypothetical protein [Candidatus Eisenbacteria bacterium]